MELLCVPNHLIKHFETSFLWLISQVLGYYVAFMTFRYQSVEDCRCCGLPGRSKTSDLFLSQVSTSSKENELLCV